MSSTVGAVTPVSKHSDDFARVEQQLQLAFRSTAVREIAAWSISNPHLSTQFDRRSRNLLSVDCLVDASELDESNAVQDVCKRGFHIPAGTGMLFSTGALRVSRESPPMRQYVLCSVAVGRSFVVDDPSTKRDLPAGYDSLYLHEGSDSPSFRYTYQLFDTAQVLPKFVIHCTYDPLDAAHSAPLRSVNMAEIKARVADALAVLGPSAPAATEKMLSDIGDAYESALAASAAPDPLLEDRKRSIGDSLRLIDERLRSVQSNASSVEEALYAKLQEALSALQSATAAKVNMLLSEELELRRQLSAIEASESFIPVLASSLPPMSFIAAWERHSAARSQMAASLAGGSVASVVRLLDDVQPDLKLTGDITVVSERAALAAAAMSTAGAGRSTRMGGVPMSSIMDLYAPSPAAPAAGMAGGGSDVHAMWTALLRQNMGLPGGSSTPHGAEALLEASQAQLALAQANLAAVEAAAAHAPPTMRSTGDMARMEAHNAVAEAQSMMKAIAAATPAAAPHAAAPVPRPPPATSRRPSEAPQPAPAPAPASRTPPRSAAPEPEVISPSTTGLSRTIPLSERIARFSLAREGERHRRQLMASGIPPDSIDPALAFRDTRILTPGQAMDLYLNLPFGQAEDPVTGGLGNVPPTTHMLFATYNDSPPTMQHFAQLWQIAQAATPTIVLVKASTGAVFGGYAAEPWDFSDLYGGSPKSFLFSITRDCKIPYHGRVKGPKQASDDMLRQAHEMGEEQAIGMWQQRVAAARMSGTEQYDAAGRLLEAQYDENGNAVALIPVAPPRPRPFVRHDCLRSNADSIQFGLRDLVLTGDLSACSSELEASYGIGLKPGSAEAQSFLAGAHIFSVAELEIWEVTANPAESVTAALSGAEEDADGTPPPDAAGVPAGRGGFF